MDNKSHTGIYAIIAAVITATAGIITAIVSMSGPLIDKKMAIQATQTREAALAAMAQGNNVAIQVTNILPAAATTAPTATTLGAAAPTAAGARPTLAAQPTTAGSTTAAPTVTLTPVSAGGVPSEGLLRVGEGITSHGITVKLAQVEFPAGDEIHLHFTFTNETNKVVNLSLDHNRDVTLTDNQGKVYTWATAFSWDVSIYPGTTRNDEVKRRGDVSKADYFIIKLDIPGLLSAQWRN